MNKAMIFTVLLIALTAFKHTDKQILNEIPGKSYYPIIKGQSFIYKTDLSTYSITFDTTITQLNGNIYIKCTSNFGVSQSICYYREEAGRVLYLKQGQTNETVQIPERPATGLVWYEADSTWKYTITSVSETFETPEKKYVNCLVIQSENINRIANPDHYRLYAQYFQRGRGYVGSKVGGIVYSYLTNDK